MMIGTGNLAIIPIAAGKQRRNRLRPLPAFGIGRRDGQNIPLVLSCV